MCTRCGKEKRRPRCRVCQNCWELRRQRPLPFDEAYIEMRYQCGWSDWEIAKHFGIQPLSLLRQLARHKIEPTPQFAMACVELKRETEQAHRTHRTLQCV